MLARQQIPNLLTFARVLAVPLCLAMILFLPNAHEALLAVFVAASITDFLDGYLARKWNATSRLGTLLDPIADKLLVALTLVYICTQHYSSYWCDNQAANFYQFTQVKLVPIAIILMRELYISGLREFLANQQIALPVSTAGKWKTALQMIAIALILASHMHKPSNPTEHSCEGATTFSMAAFNADLALHVGFALLCMAALLAFTSAVSYTRASWKHLR